MKFTASILSSLILGGLFISGVAAASQSDRSLTVKFEDLNLSSTAGVVTLYKRIHLAAAAVCQDPSDSKRLSGQAEALKCMRSAEEGAVRHVNVAALSAYYEGKSGHAASSMVASN